MHPEGTGEDLEIWIDPLYIRAGYGWSFPAGDELRVGVGSFEPRDHVREPTVRLAGDLGLPPDGYQGNWIPHKLRPAVEDGVFFVGDSAGHCLPLTAEGIRTAFYFGLACGRELRAVTEGRMHRETALARYGAFSDEHAWATPGCSTVSIWSAASPAARAQQLHGRHRPPAIVHWMFNHYLDIARPPSCAAATCASPSRRGPQPPPDRGREVAARTAAAVRVSPPRPRAAPGA